MSEGKTLLQQKRMHLSVRRGLTGVWLSVIGQPAVFAAASGDDPEGSRLLMFAIPALLASLVAVWLYRQSRRIGEGERRIAETGPGAGVTQDEGDSLLPAIFHEVGKLGRSSQERKEVAKTLSHLMTQQLEAKATSVREEVARQYEQVVEQKTRAEATVRKQYHATLTEKSQTESVLRSVAEGMVVLDTQGSVIFMNPAAEKILAVTKEEQLGKPLSDGMRDEQLVSLVTESASGGGREIELQAQRDDTKRTVRASNAVIEDENGKTIGMVAVLSDVTKQKELDRLKSEFASKMTHELRTPTVAIQHSLSLLKDEVLGPLSKEQQKFLGVADRNLERITRLVTDLLNMAKLEAHKVELRCELIPLEPVINETCEALGAWAQTKSLILEKRLAPDLPQLNLDAERLGQVLHNLIGNAIKFTPAKGTIRIEATRRDGGGEVEVSVTDTGVGIAKEGLEKLFQKFQQVGERSATDISGTGLGLAIAKEIIELHQGRIWAESEEGCGATFTFTLPIAAQAEGG